MTSTVREKARVPIWVIRVVLTVGQPLPVYPNQRTFAGYVGMSQTCQDRTHASQQKVDGDLIMMRDYEPQSDAATRRMLASATGMAAALSFGCVFVGTIVSALLSRLS
jgi:hypothetical protein